MFSWNIWNINMIKKTLLILAALATPAFADPAVIENVKVSKGAGTYTFDVTVSHTDMGWDDYADSWRIKDMDGNVLGERALAHPHVNEQPFTRSLSGISIPDGITEVMIEAHDTVTGWSPNVKTVRLP
jgi:hypothetical protein